MLQITWESKAEDWKFPASLRDKLKDLRRNADGTARLPDSTLGGGICGLIVNFANDFLTLNDFCGFCAAEE